MIIRLLIAMMMVLAIAKYYLHDTQQTDQTKPEVVIKDVKQQLQKIQDQQKENQEKLLEHLNK